MNLPHMWATLLLQSPTHLTIIGPPGCPHVSLPITPEHFAILHEWFLAKQRAEPPAPMPTPVVDLSAITLDI